MSHFTALDRIKLPNNNKAAQLNILEKPLPL